MDENKRNIDDILAEDDDSGHSARDISEKANRQAEEILAQLRLSTASTDAEEEDIDDFLAELTARRRSKKVPAEPKAAPEPAQEAEAATPQATAAEEASPQTPTISVIEQPKPVPQQKEITRAPVPSDIPQSKKRHRSLDEVLRSIDEASETDETTSKIDRAVEGREQVHPRKKAERLSRTGVIRKANALIGTDPEDGIDRSTPAPTAEREGALRTQEVVVGERDDVKARAYGEYIRARERRKQDTGMIKTIDIRVAGKKKEPTLSEDTEKTTVVPARVTGEERAKPLIDEETPIERTIVGRGPKRLITPVPNSDKLEGQISIAGFFDEEASDKISEEELELQVEQNRQKKVGTFTLEQSFLDQNSDFAETASQSSIDETYAPEKETPVIDDVIDYNSKSDERAIYIELEQLSNRFKLRTTLTFIATAAAAVVGLFGSGILSDFGLGTGGERPYIIINSILLFLMMAVNFRPIFKGLKALFVLKPSEDSVMSLAVPVTVAHCALSFLLGERGIGVSHLYVGTMGFILLLNCLGKKSMMRRIFRNFRFLKDGNKYSSACITDPKEIKEFSKGSEESDYDIRFNVRTEFPTRFLANSYADDPADTIAKNAAYPAIAAAFIAGVIGFLITKDWLSAVSALTVTLLAAVPASAMYSFHRALENADRELLRERGTITGFAALGDAAQTTAVVIDGEDLFPKGYCHFKGIQYFNGMQPDEAILYAVSVLRYTKLPLRYEMMESAMEVEDKIPKAFDVAVEAKLGVSAWIYERKVLVGTEQMMLSHGMTIPSRAKPEKYNRNNSRTLFLSIDGTVYAMFVCEYYSEPTVEFELQRLEAAGIDLFVKTEDPHIDEALISEVFAIDPNSVKRISRLAGEMYEEKTSRSVYNEAKLVNRGDPITFIRSIIAASVLSSQLRFMKLLHYLSIILGVLPVIVVTCMNSLSAIHPLHIVLYASVWLILTIIIPKVNKAVPKR